MADLSKIIDQAFYIPEVKITDQIFIFLPTMNPVFWMISLSSNLISCNTTISALYFFSPLMISTLNPTGLHTQ